MYKIRLKGIEFSNGEKLAYRIGGTGETILLVHGNLVSSRHWGNLLEKLAKNYKVIAIDLRGAGHSSYNNPIETFKDWAYDIKLFCDELALKDFILLGWSMGGGISQQFVVDYPDYAKKLILYQSIPATGYPYQKKGLNGEFLNEYYDNKEDLLKDPIQLKPMIYGLESKDKKSLRQLWNSTVLNVNTPDEEEYDALIDDVLMTRNLKDAAWAAHIFNISHVHNGVVDGTGEIDKINIPVLIFAGDKDIICPIPMAEFTKKQIGENAKLAILKNCSHTPHYDNINLVIENIDDFIRN